VQGLSEVIELLGLTILLSLVTYRVSRFIVLDTLWEKSRDRFAAWLEVRDNIAADKFGELIGCPFCVSVWVAAGSVGATALFVDPVPMPVWVWLATATLALVWWAVIDPEE